MRQRIKTVVLLVLVLGLAVALVDERWTSKGHSRFRIPAPASFTVTAAATSGLTGHVVDRESGKPVQGATVELGYFSADAVWPFFGRGAFYDAKVQTDRDGAFAFTNLEPRDYVVAVTLDHYVRQEYGQRAVGFRGTLIPVRRGERVDSVDFQISKKSAIEGRIRTRFGLPAAGVTMRLYTGAFVPFSVKTDGLGRYRFEDIEPDDYYVVAGFVPDAYAREEDWNSVCDESSRRSGDRGGGLGQADIRMSYPGVVDFADAELVHVPPGGEVRQIDFAIRPIQTGTVTGTVSLPADAGATARPAAPPCTSVVMLPVEQGFPRAKLPEAPVFRTRGDGSFQFNDVVPGAYRIVAISGSADRADRFLVATRGIDVRPGGSQTVTLALEHLVDIPGRIAIDSPVPQGFDIEKFQVHPTLTGEVYDVLYGFGSTAGFRENFSRVKHDGSFVLRHIIPGARYEVYPHYFQEGPPIWYQVVTRYAGRETSGRETIVMQDGGTVLDMHVGFGSSRVEVAVMDRGKPQAGVVTLLVNRRRNARDGAPFEISDAQGRVTFSRIAAGDYDVYAWEGLAGPFWGQVSFMEQFKGRGTFIRVGKDGTAKATVQVIRPDGVLVN